MPNFDVVIIGSGLAALTAAYRLSSEKNVIVITKSKKTNSNSILAQGGVASSLGDDDSWISHYTDTIIAGCQHNKNGAVEVLVKNGPNFISELMLGGMKFDQDKNGKLLLGKEGAHSTRRILHAGGDATGRELVRYMLDKVKNKVKIIEDEIAIDLIVVDQRCVGVETINNYDILQQYFAPHIILATGGCGTLYSFTSNDESITGDGLALAYRAGAELIDLEFIQFHPTLLNVDGKGRGLISEAVRGEGAVLVDEAGRGIMRNVHPLGDLAPRDVVARTIFNEMMRDNKISLDITMIKNFETRFPTIAQICKKNGVSFEDGKIPVIPGAHFLMGGVKTDQIGRTSITGLYAVGEVACTGVHGANRLASNSLLEGIVFGNLVADEILSSRLSYFEKFTAETPEKKKQLINLPTKEQIQQMMTENVGIVRNKEKLQLAVDWFAGYKKKFNGKALASFNKEQLILINMITVGWLMATSALMRTESRGGHFREDFPLEDNFNWLKKELIRTNHEEALNEERAVVL